jgi:hypothetical protein
MAAVTLSPGFRVLALKIQEATLQHSDVKARLKDIVNDHVQNSGKSHADDEYMDHDGDGTEGNCTYMCKGDIRQAPYELGTSGGKAGGSIDFDNSKNVVPVTNYVPEADDSDHYTSTDEAYREAGIYVALPVYERFISKKTRDAADTSDFAGKGRSFPVLKPADVSAALHSIGRAGPDNHQGSTIRANIKKIAKRKGYALPDSLKDASDASEARRGTPQSTWKPEGVLLVESSAVWCEQPRLKEAATASFPIKLMSPGRGSSGYYPPETLKKASESKVFKAGTQMFWNHDTDQEEAGRPEGDLNRLAAVTTSDATWQENGHDGPGLYAQAKVFSDYADKVKEMGPHIGLSIRAGGDRDESAKGPDGKPRVITALRNAASVDFVTKAGRDGKIFTESATQGEDMDKNEVQALIRESLAPLQAENKQLKEMLAATRGPAIIGKHLAAIRLPDAIKSKISESLALSIPMDAAGNVDDKKLGELVEAKAKEWIELLPALGFSGNPAELGTRLTEADVTADIKLFEESQETVNAKLADLFVGPKLGKGTVSDEAREARKRARKAFVEGRAA